VNKLRINTGLLAIGALLLAATGNAQIEDLRLPISLDADSTAYDGNSSMLVFKGLRLTQGSIGVQADEGRASKLDFQDSLWRFEGNVLIDVDNGHIECDSADLRFADHELQHATIRGNPATFEVRRPGSDETTRAQAGQLEYDLKTSVIEFSGNAVFTEGGNQISSSFIAYNINERRINAQSSGAGDDKVKITFTPQDTDQPDAGEATRDDEGVEDP